MTSLSNAPAGSQLQLNFAYDYKGRRIQKTVSTNSGSAYVVQSKTAFLDDGWNLIAELNVLSTPTLVRSYVWGLDLSGTRQGAGGVGGLLEVTYCGTQTTNCFAAFDGNGNVGALANAVGGTVVAQYEYGPFGEVLRATGPMAEASALRFSTKYQDAETDLVYRPGGRYVIPSIGRWASRESIGESGAANPYSLGHCDPINYGVNDPPVFISPPPLPNPVIPPFWQLPGKPIIGGPINWPVSPPSAPPRNPPGKGPPSNVASASGGAIATCAAAWGDIFNVWEVADGVKICGKEASSLGFGERCCVIILCVKCSCIEDHVIVKRVATFLADMNCAQARHEGSGDSGSGTQYRVGCPDCTYNRNVRYETIMTTSSTK